MISLSLSSCTIFLLYCILEGILFHVYFQSIILKYSSWYKGDNLINIRLNFETCWIWILPSNYRVNIFPFEVLAIDYFADEVLPNVEDDLFLLATALGYSQRVKVNANEAYFCRRLMETVVSWFYSCGDQWGRQDEQHQGQAVEGLDCCSHLRIEVKSTWISSQQYFQADSHSNTDFW